MSFKKSLVHSNIQKWIGEIKNSLYLMNEEKYTELLKFAKLQKGDLYENH